MGNLKTMKYLVMLFSLGMGGIFISCIYFYILWIGHPFCVCVWQWSDNLLSGNRWFDRWAKRCLEAECRGYLGFWKSFHI